VPPSKLRVKLSKKQENALLNALELNVKDRTATVDEFLRGITDTKIKVKRTKVKKEKNDLGKLSFKSKLGIGLGIVAVVLAFIVGYQAVRDNLINDHETLAENQVYVPNVLNMNYNEAEALLADSGLVAVVVKRSFEDDMPPDIVIEQGVLAGDIVDKGTEVTLVLSNGGTGTYVENYVGMHKEEVIEKLDELGVYGDFEEVESAVAPGVIVSQDVSYETAVQKGTVIKFQVSAGLADIDNGETKVPDLVGKTYDEAIVVVKTCGLYLQRTEIIYDPEIPEGQILSQNVDEGEEIALGTIIEVQVSGGIEKVRIPSVRGMNINTVEDELSELGLNVVVDFDTIQTGQACCVNGVDISEGTLVEKGTTVTIYGIRGIIINGQIIDPEKESNNYYKVGDEIRITVQIDVEQAGMKGTFLKEFGFQYNNEILEYKGIEGPATASLINNHEEYGDCMLIRYNISEPQVTDTFVLIFTALKPGKDEVGTFLYQTRISENTWNAHLWHISNVPSDFTFKEKLEHIIDIEVTE